MKRNFLFVLLLGILFFSVSGCKSIPDPSEIPEDESIALLSQNGQSALDDNNYKAAEVYYQVIIDRYGTDAGVRIAAEFEIAHIRMKQKEWTDAQTRLEKIIASYETTGGTDLPPEYLVLAKNDLARIPENKKIKEVTTEAKTTEVTSDETSVAEEPAQ